MKGHSDLEKLLTEDIAKQIAEYLDKQSLRSIRCASKTAFRLFSKTIEIQKSIEAEAPIFHIILDIDGTLANGCGKKTIQKVLADDPHLQPLFDNGLFIHAIIPHYLHPGVLEFIQWLFQIPHVEVSFFSSGAEQRNIMFVQALLTRALGNSFNIKDISIYSNQHLVRSKREDVKNQFRLFGIYHGTMKKDLIKIPKIKNLDNVVLIDDDPSFIAFGQEKHVFRILEARDSNFFEFYRFSEECPDEVGEHILRINHIFYLTGLLCKMISMKDHSLADNLFNLQYKSVGEGIYKLNEDMQGDHQYYLDGLEELQKVNSQLEFYGGDLANKHFRKSGFTKTS